MSATKIRKSDAPGHAGRFLRLAGVLVLGAWLCGSAFAAQIRSLYFVSARPMEPRPVTYPAVLRVLDEKNLDLTLVRELVSQKDGVGLVLSDTELRTVIAGSPPGAMSHFSLVDMDQPWVARSFNASRPGMLPVHWCLLRLPSGDRYFGLQLLDATKKPFRWESIGVNLSTLEMRELPFNQYQYSSINGLQGWGPPNRDVLQVFPFDDGRLTLREAGVLTKTDWVLPKELRFPRDSYVWTIINNSEIRALSGGDDKPRKFHEIRVLDKRQNHWHIATVPGDWDQPRGFGAWIVFMLQEEAHGRESPGSEERLHRQSEFTFDDYMADMDLYRSGVLILHNGHTQKTYTLETHQGDSEVLLIDSNMVYYRVNRAIWKAEIRPDGVDRPSLVFEGDIVRDIHWAFFGPPPPTRPAAPATRP